MVRLFLTILSLYLANSDIAAGDLGGKCKAKTVNPVRRLLADNPGECNSPPATNGTCLKKDDNGALLEDCVGTITDCVCAIKPALNEACT